ncbi:hypothetical protein H4696_003446 [Amycolatopsis lexingtonensis]|uniref:MafI family immunity protein n=1 Tax=Amycolatopsis lexingtonensis TaxID=218822 RepID=A0ABR9HZK2_9PSEU|nr:MafI family immunity protein [Amycolatopsis lexingtonensis]MBE1496346.1 hypothetical protein [Amycolatopsis lexingtonensis]
MVERYEYVKELVLGLLADSPIVREEVISDVRHLVSAGEEELAFGTLCSWIYEDELRISAQFYEKLRRAASELGENKSIEKLDELLTE